MDTPVRVNSITASQHRPATEIVFNPPNDDGAASARQTAVTRKGWVRSHVALVFLGIDAFGISIAWLIAMYGGWQPGYISLSGMLVGAVVAYVFGAFSVPRPEHPSSAMVGAAAGGLAACATVALIGGLTDAPLIALLPRLAPVGWPVLTRLLIGRILRNRVANARWLVMGTPEVLGQIERERDQAHLQGEFCYLVAPGQGEPPSGVVGISEKVGDFLSRRWTGLVVAGMDVTDDTMVRDLMRARLAGLRIYDLTEFWELHLRKVPVLHLSAGWVVMSHGFQLLHDPASLRIKRLGDIALASLGLLLAWPFMLLTAAMVKLTSPGPALFTQDRVGARGEQFTLFKFRSMRNDAERNGAQWAKVGDARVTSIGAFIRKTRLDELPQLWNILRGDMSFIGPRPERKVFTDQLAQQIPFYHLRHVVKPGLTGWAQVNYPYGASVQDAIEKLQYDLWYIKHHSLFLDMRIILKTIRVVLFGMGR